MGWYYIFKIPFLQLLTHFTYFLLTWIRDLLFFLLGFFINYLQNMPYYEKYPCYLIYYHLRDFFKNHLQSFPNYCLNEFNIRLVMFFTYFAISLLKNLVILLLVIKNSFFNLLRNDCLIMSMRIDFEHFKFQIKSFYTFEYPSSRYFNFNYHVKPIS